MHFNDLLLEILKSLDNSNSFLKYVFVRVERTCLMSH